MPVRTLLYDALAYTEQKDNLELKQKKDGSYYRGKLTKNQKLIPVLSLKYLLLKINTLLLAPLQLPIYCV